MIEYEVSDGVCVLRLSYPPVNAITFELLEELRSAVARANGQADVRGIVLTGQAGHFSAGADVGIFERITSDRQAIETSRVFQESFAAVEDSAKPVAAAVAGRVMGSALELALACHVRLCRRDCKFSMPEVTLGINPGAGGTGRLPRLIGAAEAMKMLLGARAINAEEACVLGLIDAVCDGEQLLAAACSAVQDAPRPRRTSLLTDKIGDAAANAAALDAAEQSLAGARPEIIAPRKIIEAVRAGLDESFEAGLLAERRVFAECMATRATQNKIYLFFATRETGKVSEAPGAEAGEVAKTGVVGTGSMGTGIAHALAIARLPVTALDEDPAALEKATDRITRSVRKRVAAGKLAAARAESLLALISTTTDYRDLADAKIVVEAVFEDARVKRSVIARLEAACRPDAIIATNTSTISLDVLADGMRRPERLVGMHFFNPAHRMPLVEIIRSEATGAAAVATALKLAKMLRKTPVLVRSRAGFVVNRLFIPYLKEAFRLLEEGAEPEAIDAAAVEFGFPMGPLALTDMAGLDILVSTDAVLRRAFARHGPMPAVVDRLAAGGHLGQKTGSGVYKYAAGDHTPRPSAAARQIVAEIRRETGRAARPIGADEITERLVMRMVCEAFYVLQEKLVPRESDIDAAMVLGVGWPDFTGGVLRYARDVGLDRVLTRLEQLADTCGRRFSPCELLVTLASQE